MTAVQCLVFDLDGTLYNICNGYMQHIRQNIFDLMASKGYAATTEEAEQLWRPLFKLHNQSFKGLREGGYVFGDDEYWVNHRGGMEAYFSHDESLLQLLNSLPHRKVIFTNCREQEAERILELLGVRQCFDTVYGADLWEMCANRSARASKWCSKT